MNSKLAREFPKPHVTIDLAIFSLREGALNILLTRRATEPFAGQWALPGGYVHIDEDADLNVAAHRILLEKTGLATAYIEQLQGFGNATRDPRGWTATFAYFALIASTDLAVRGGGNASDAAWYRIGDTETLAFDHDTILETALARLRAKIEYTSLPVHLLPQKFTLPELQAVYEQILGRRLEKSAFRKKIAEAGFLEPVEGEQRHASNRPAQLYRLKPGLQVAYLEKTI